MWVLDTSALSPVMHREVDALNRLRRLRPSEVILSSPVAAEIRFGLARLESGSKQRRILENEYRTFRNATTWADWTETAADLFGEIKAGLQRNGVTIQDLDIAIASIALERGARVATRNVKHFEPIDGLVVDDWAATS